MAQLGNTIINGALRANGKINASGAITAPSFVGVASQIKGTLTNPTSTTSYFIPFFAEADNAAGKNIRLNNGIRYHALEGTTSAVGAGILILGNGTPSGTAGNKYGAVQFASTKEGGVTLRAADSTTSKTIYLPAADGTLALTTSNVASATKATQDGDGKTISSTYLKLTGGTLSGDLNFSHNGSGNPAQLGWTSGTVMERIRVHDESTASHNVFEFQRSTDSGTTYFNIMTITSDSKVNATTFVGALSGNATSASKLATARTITLGGVVTGSTTFDGSGNKTITTAIDGFSTIQTITKSMTLTTAWQDTGILTSNLTAGSGSYLIQVSINGRGTGNSYYDEFWTGVMSVYTGNSNSTDSSEIVLHNCGHATNNDTIFLRVVKQGGSTASPKIQISDSHAWSAAATITFKFRRLI